MELNEKDIKKFSIILLIGIIAVLSFILIRPIIFAIIGGLILAYITKPLFDKVLYVVRNRTIAATIVLFIVIVLIVIPLWFITPLIVNQVFEIFRSSQTLDVQQFVRTIFPTAQDQFIAQLTATFGTIVSKISSSILNTLINVFLDLPQITINMFVIGFILFYTLRDSNKLQLFFSGLSPLHPDKEKILVEQFKSITNAIVYGLFIVGIVQGLLAGLGFLLFGVENALTLTILATIISVIPILGPYLVWIPVSFFLFTTSNFWLAFGFLLYNLIVVSTADNVLRSYIVSRKTKISPAIVMVGMMGGIFVFGIMGLLLGPLILAYFLVLLRSYKDRNLYTLFSDKV